MRLFLFTSAKVSTEMFLFDEDVSIKIPKILCLAR